MRSSRYPVRWQARVNRPAASVMPLCAAPGYPGSAAGNPQSRFQAQMSMGAGVTVAYCTTPMVITGSLAGLSQRMIVRSSA